MAPKAEPTPSPITLPELEGIIGKSGGQCYAVEFAASLLMKIERRGVHPGGSNEDAPRALCSFVPLSNQAVAILQEVQEISGRKEGYVFTASHTVTRLLSENTLNAARNSAGKQSRRD
jgi:hypothetical protein